jgi:murein DD-endopeptidase MepM/ murein hydrolase activator NlpD
MRSQRKMAGALLALLLAACSGTSAPGLPATVTPSSASPREPETASASVPTTEPLPIAATGAETGGAETAGADLWLPPPPGVDPDSGCLRRADFGDPRHSEYVLPFAIGMSYQVSQSYCYSNGGHRNQLAYDFVLPIGADVVAARAGEVVAVREDSPDDGQGQGEHNYVFIRHEDGTVAFYAHLAQDRVDVEVGDLVEQGERIGASGNSGLTGGPHLHFGVYRTWPNREGHDVPVNFSNADGPLDARGGLLSGRMYTALDRPIDYDPRPEQRGINLDAIIASGDLAGRDLAGAPLAGKDLRGVDLSGAYLPLADLSGTDLTGASLRGCDLEAADLSNAILRGADLTGAWLAGADLRGADLTGAHLDGMVAAGAVYDGATQWPVGFTPPPLP